MEFDFLWYGIFLLTGIFAGFIDSIAGGGGIISLPVLILSGIAPHEALATNKLQSTFGSFTASLNYIHKGLVKIKEVIFGVLFTFIGASIGTLSILKFDASFLNQLIPIMLAIIFIYTLFSPKLGENDRQHKLPTNVFYFLFGILLGFYDGFFGPGTGSFWTIALITLLGLNLKTATARTKIMNFTSNFVSLCIFLLNGQVLWIAGILMGIGQMIGAFIGSSLVVKKDVKFIRIFFLSVVGVTILNLIYVNYIK